MKKFLLLFVLPTLAILLLAVWPLIEGGRTLFLRDTFNTHLEMKWVQAEAMRDGYLPLVDPYRDGGQPLLGNLNSVPLYPDNLLYLVASPIWALNAHFWLHLLLAPFAAFWMARAWGLERESAWAVGACYAVSGYFWSNLNLYNLIAGVTLAPALVASMLMLAGRRRVGWSLAGTGLLWTLLLLAGDPMIAVLALAAALAAVAFRFGARAWLRVDLISALGLGSLVAAPQLVELARILPLSFRGHWGYSASAATAASWNPATALEWLVPFLFGRPDLSFWGREIFSGELPLFFTLYPGLLVLALVLSSGGPRSPAVRWAWVMAAAGLFLALGRFNPVVRWLLEIPGASLMRLPVKTWLLVALGGSLLAGVGWERVFRQRLRASMAYSLLGLGSLFLVSWAALSLFPRQADAGLRRLIPDLFPDAFVSHERLRVAGLCLVSLLLAAGLGLAFRLSRGRPRMGAAAMLILHLAAQTWLLKPVIPTDETAFYRTPPALLESVEPGEIVAHGRAGGLFGADSLSLSRAGDPRADRLQRQLFEELYPFAGVLWGRTYAFAHSPEGLSSFLTRATAQAVSALPDLHRVRLLSASGVDLLILNRRLAPATSQEAELVLRRPGPRGEIYLYRILGSVPEVAFVGEVHRAPHLNAALELLTDPSFDPRVATVLPGEGEPSAGAGGEVTVRASGPEALEIQVEARSAGALVVGRPILPIYRAEVDGSPLPLQAANLHHIGLELPAGSHRVRLWVDRRPLLLSSLLSLFSLVALLALARRRAGRDGAEAA